jgi:hypothetical protein
MDQEEEIAMQEFARFEEKLKAQRGTAFDTEQQSAVPL